MMSFWNTASVPSVPTDPQFLNVVLSAHFNGANGSTTFLDSSSNTKTLTAVGNAQLTDSDPKFGSASLLLDGIGDGVSVAADADFSIGADEEFCVESWVYCTDRSQGRVAVQFGTGATQSFYLGLSIYTPGKLALMSGLGANLIVDTVDFPLNTWVHIAVTRDENNDVRLFKNLVEVGTSVNSTQNYGGTNVVYIGIISDETNWPWAGKVDDARITIDLNGSGASRYVTDGTPPTEQFPDS